jgi:GAF domain-containing protein
MIQMTADPQRLLADLASLTSSDGDRVTLFQAAADCIKSEGGYRWVGLYDVDSFAGIVANIVWSGLGAPTHLTFPLTSGLTGAAIANRKMINVGDVAVDPRYLTALGTTRSEIIVPVFDQSGENVIGTIDVESAELNAFGEDAETLLEACSEVLQPLWQR